jgi:hypothetical protein
MFADVANPFGTDAFTAPASTPRTTTYYKSMRLVKKPALRMPSAPKPLSHHIKNLLLSDK